MSSTQTLPASAVAASPDDSRIGLRAWIAVLAGILGAFMALLDIGITNSSLKHILGTLSATQEEGSWVTTAYLTAEIIAMPLTASFSRVFGTRNYMIGNTTLFLLFSTLCGAAWNLQSMIIFRTLQGFASGAMIPMAMTLMLGKFPPSKRALGMAVFGLTAFIAPTLGPTFGGFLTDIYGWPSIFYINWAPGLLLIVGLLYGLDHEPMQLKKLISTDWLGISFMALGLGSLTVFLEEGNLKDWLNSSFIVTFAGLAIFGLLGWFVTNVLRKEPFINLSLLWQRNFFVSTVVSAVAGMALYGCAFLLPLYLGQIAHYTPMQIGQVLMWAGLPQLVVMPLAAALSSKVDNRILCSIGLALFGTSCLMNVNIDATTGYDQLLMSQVVRSLGQPFILLTLANFAMDKIPPSDTGSASSLYNMTRNLGGSIGIALLATALSNRQHFHADRLGEAVSLYSAATQLRLEQLTQSFISRGIDPVTAANQALQTIDNLVRREAYVMAYNDNFLFMGAILFCSIGVLWFADKIKTPTHGQADAH